MKDPRAVNGAGKERGREAGATVIEVLIIAAILTSLAVAASVRFENFTSTQAQWALHEVRSAMHYAQRFALYTKIRTRVTFDTANEEVEVERETTPGNWAYLTHPKGGGNFIVALGLGEYADVAITSASIPNERVIYDASGIPYDRDGVALAATGTVVFNGAGGWELRITQETGHIDLVDV
jgi:Tfp pilus assembly protein FimT